MLTVVVTLNMKNLNINSGEKYLLSKAKLWEDIITMPSIGQLVECRQLTWNLET